MRMNTPGHALRNDGGPYRRQNNKWVTWTKDRVGNGLCYCGQASPVVKTRAARKAWHKDHIALVRGEVPEVVDRPVESVLKILEMDLINARIRSDAKLGQDVITMPYSDLIRLVALCADGYALSGDNTTEAFEKYLERTERLGGLAALAEPSNVSGRV